MRSIFDFFKKSTPEKKIQIYPELSSTKKKASPSPFSIAQEEPDNAGNAGCDTKNENCTEQLGEKLVKDEQSKSEGSVTEHENLNAILVTPPTPTSPINQAFQPDVNKDEIQGKEEASFVSEVSNQNFQAIEQATDPTDQKGTATCNTEISGTTEHHHTSELDSEEFQSVTDGGDTITRMDSGDEVFVSAVESPPDSAAASSKAKEVKPRDYSMAIESGPSQIYLEPEPPDIGAEEGAEGDNAEKSSNSGKRKKSRKRSDAKKDDEACCFLGEPGLDSISDFTAPQNTEGNGEIGYDSQSLVVSSNVVLDGTDSGLGRGQGQSAQSSQGGNICSEVTFVFPGNSDAQKGMVVNENDIGNSTNIETVATIKNLSDSECVPMETDIVLSLDSRTRKNRNAWFVKLPLDEQRYLTDPESEDHRDLFDLISRMLEYNPSERISLRQAFKHPFFATFYRTDANNSSDPEATDRERSHSLSR
ncbi:hypothetical protein FSP39_014932 [Pinctada imbricata]|uniref:Protein kinase domain-containing protein n=1 Tax=Pinctada imbricata TaxID=66713 RepID=A0AA88XPH3_PINIB|nr:hypothetical protein FSP39_014932 [Pinctada imbricata]